MHVAGDPQPLFDHRTLDVAVAELGDPLRDRLRLAEPSRSLRIASPMSTAVTPIATPPSSHTGTGLSSPVMPTAAAITVPA